MHITIDFEGALARALAPEAMAPILDKHITAAITNAISDATGWNSEFQKALKAQLAEALPHGLAIADVAKFQHVLNATLQGFVGEANKASIEAAMKKAVTITMPDVPRVLKLSKFMESARAGLHKEERDPIYAYMEVSDYGTTYISIDSSERPGLLESRHGRARMQYHADYRLSVNKAGEVYALKLHGQQLTPSSLPDVIGEFDAALMAMYVGRTRLEIDMDDGDLESLSAEKYD